MTDDTSVITSFSHTHGNKNPGVPETPSARIAGEPPSRRRNRDMSETSERPRGDEQRSNRPPADQDTQEMLAEWIDAKDSSGVSVEHEGHAGDPAGLVGLTTEGHR